MSGPSLDFYVTKTRPEMSGIQLAVALVEGLVERGLRMNPEVNGFDAIACLIPAENLSNVAVVMHKMHEVNGGCMLWVFGDLPCRYTGEVAYISCMVVISGQRSEVFVGFERAISYWELDPGKNESRDVARYLDLISNTLARRGIEILETKMQYEF